MRAPVSLATTAVQPLSLALHELATNAARFGAASTETGAVSISWAVNNNGLEIVWREKNKHEIAAPRQLGVGLSPLQGVVESQVDGELGLKWSAEGLEARVTVPPTRHFLDSRAGSHVES